MPRSVVLLLKWHGPSLIAPQTAHVISIRLVCRSFNIGETSYRYQTSVMTMYSLQNISLDSLKKIQIGALVYVSLIYVMLKAIYN